LKSGTRQAYWPAKSPIWLTHTSRSIETNTAASVVCPLAETAFFELWGPAAVALYHFSYNFVKIHRTLRCTPAMAAGVTDRLWEVSDLVALLEASERGLERAARATERTPREVVKAFLKPADAPAPPPKPESRKRAGTAKSKAKRTA
jgi:hypothetical protein